MRLRREEDGVELKLSQGEASLLTRVLTNYLIARLEQLVQASPADRGLSPSAEGSTES
jgi:hypothetical protein